MSGMPIVNEEINALKKMRHGTHACKSIEERTMSGQSRRRCHM